MAKEINVVYSSRFPSLTLHLDGERTIQFKDGVYAPETQEEVEELDNHIKLMQKNGASLGGVLQKIDVNAASAVVEENIKTRLEQSRAVSGPFTTSNSISSFSAKVATDAQHQGNPAATVSSVIAALK